VIEAIDKHVVARQGQPQDPKRFGSIYYNLGVENGILNVEAIRVRRPSSASGR
jgi:branched-chain amino acid transport system substrate-binding protein